MKSKVLVTSRSFGKVGDEAVKLLSDADIHIDYSAAGQFDEKIEQYDALIIGAHQFKESVMEKCKSLKIICKHGAELDNIPLDKAKTMGITVTNVPGVNSNRVADLTFGLLLSVARQITYTNRMVHEGRWQTAIGTDVFGKTLGLLGFGSIAKNVARRANGFQMKVIACDPYVTEISSEFKYVTMCSLDEVLENSDFLSLHLPLSNDTHNLLSKYNLSKMKKGSYIINTAKGEIIDEYALYELLCSNHLAGAAMDVCTMEPISMSNPLLTLDNVIITPHIGVYTKEAISEVSLICAQNVAAKLSGHEVNFAVV